MSAPLRGPYRPVESLSLTEHIYFKSLWLPIRSTCRRGWKNKPGEEGAFSKVSKEWKELSPEEKLKYREKRQALFKKNS